MSIISPTQKMLTFEPVVQVTVQLKHPSVLDAYRYLAIVIQQRLFQTIKDLATQLISQNLKNLTVIRSSR